MADNNEQNTQPATLEEYIAQHQQQWSNVILEMNNMMKKFVDLPDLQMTIYSKRQNALDYYFNLLYKFFSLIWNNNLRSITSIFYSFNSL